MGKFFVYKNLTNFIKMDAERKDAIVTNTLFSVVDILDIA